MDKETSIIKCKECGETKVRYLAGTYPKGDKKWVDENNLEFNGKLCPSCHQDKVRQRKQNKKKNSYF